MTDDGYGGRNNGTGTSGTGTSGTTDKHDVRVTVSSAGTGGDRPSDPMSDDPVSDEDHTVSGSISLVSPVERLFGDRHHQVIRRALGDVHATRMAVTVEDNHGLDFVMRARVLAAVAHARGNGGGGHGDHGARGERGDRGRRLPGGSDGSSGRAEGSIGRTTVSTGGADMTTGDGGADMTTGDGTTADRKVRFARPVRSWLYVPGNRPSRMVHAADYGADGLILDLEDAVSTAEKLDARLLVAAALEGFPPFQAPTSRADGGVTTAGSATPRGTRPDALTSDAPTSDAPTPEGMTSEDGAGDGALPGPTIGVRINGLDSPWWEADLDAVIRAGARVIRVPKVEHPTDVARISDVVTGIEQEVGVQPGTVVLQCILETPLGVEHAFDVAACDRVSALCFGAEDYCAATGIDRYGPAFALDYPRSRVAAAAASRGISAYDTVWGAFRDATGLEEEARRGNAVGFCGKSVIHPDQIATVNAVFSPSARDIEWAAAVVAVEKGGATGATAVAGTMVDAPVLRRAHRILDNRR